MGTRIAGTRHQQLSVCVASVAAVVAAAAAAAAAAGKPGRRRLQRRQQRPNRRFPRAVTTLLGLMSAPPRAPGPFSCFCFPPPPRPVGTPRAPHLPRTQSRFALRLLIGGHGPQRLDGARTVPTDVGPRDPRQLHTAAKNSYSDSYLDSTGYLRIALSSNSTQIARAI